jgi:hypothetical protein
MFPLRSAIMAQTARFTVQLLSADCLSSDEHRDPRGIDFSDQCQPRQPAAELLVSPVGDGGAPSGFDFLESSNLGPSNLGATHQAATLSGVDVDLFDVSFPLKPPQNED